MGAGRARRTTPPEEPPTIPPPVIATSTPGPSSVTPTPTEALGWEAQVHIRLVTLEQSVSGLRADLDERMDRLYSILERPSLHERCMAGAGELLGRAIDRLTDPAAIKWTALVILGLVALLTGASLSGWGVTIGGQATLKQPAVHAAPAGP